MKNKTGKILIALALFTVTLTGAAYGADVVIESQKQNMKLDQNKGFFEGNVKVKIDDVTIKGPRATLDLDSATKKPSLATFYDNPYAFQSKGSKKHEVKANIIKVSLIKKYLIAEGNTQSIITENRKPIVTINAESQDYDTKTQVMTARGGVIIYYKDVETFSNEASVKVDKNGDIQRIELTGSAVVKQKANIIKGEKMCYNPKIEEYTVSGNTSSDVTLDEGTRVFVQANYQQYNRSANNLIAGGNVRVKYKDYFARGPKAQVFPNKNTGKPNEIIFTGRSKISQGPNTVEADKIKLTLKPKNFYAEGNVKTSITGGGGSGSLDMVP